MNVFVFLGDSVENRSSFGCASTMVSLNTPARARHMRPMRRGPIVTDGIAPRRGQARLQAIGEGQNALKKKPWSAVAPS